MRMRYIIICMMSVLLSMSSHLSLHAQGFNPENPAEPHLRQKITVKANPSHAVSSLSGAGYYSEGDKVRISCSSYKSEYVFSHWNKNGEYYSSNQGFDYTMGNDAVEFTAYFTYAPASPDEPQIKDNRLFFVAEPLTACSFNKASDQRYGYEEYVTVRAIANTAYSFIGWFKDGKLFSENLEFGFQMPEGDVHLVAKFEYNPFNPAEPESNGTQDNVQTTPTGDADGDGVVDVADAVRIINLCLKGEYESKADVDNDGVVDVADAVAVINKCMKYNK